MLDKLKAATKYAESHHASSWVVGVACVAAGVGVWAGVPRDAAYLISAGLVLVLVPLLNAIQDDER
ncbi:hypothetical protein GGP77_001633 [Salinibacter ruber]|uniref:hypothetical protein n=1 Tax=Salinibacter ruber TaxID=146919 RepID=UPI00216986B7|nr:hypothetical protein [Salinibacter ruber]MCS3667404.1 hypothetical protein [Salinibacter ruber]